MGQGKSNFTKQELEEYEELTYLSNSEVLQAFKKYRDIDPPKVKFYIFLQDSCNAVNQSTYVPFKHA